MSLTWMSLSVRWGLTSVQAALNVIISVLGTIGIWALSRYWWQRGGKKILQQRCDVPLPDILSIGSPGEGYDVINILRWKAFSRKHLWLFFQVLTVFLVTLVCMFAGPLAKISLKTARIVQTKQVEVLQAWNGGKDLATRNFANVEWNDTITSLDVAGFPYDQIMDYLPPSSLPWTYASSEWDPTWQAECNFYNETVLPHLVASGTATLFDPLEAFPAFGDTYDRSWLNKDQYRVEANFAGEKRGGEDGNLVITDMILWVLVQSDPAFKDRKFHNNETLHMSLSALHLKGFSVLTFDDATNNGSAAWRPNGTIENSSYTRAECSFSRKSVVADEEAIPWLWTDETFAIMFACKQFWATYVGAQSIQHQVVSPPTAHELIRFYQAYMASVTTWWPRPYTRSVSVWTDTVQLSVACLVLILLLVLLEVWLSIRYFWFLRCNKKILEQRCIPDGKIDWMVYNAKLADQISPTINLSEAGGMKSPKDRDYFRKASFGNSMTPEVQPYSLARVYNKSTLSPATSRGDVRSSLSQKPTQYTLPRIVVSHKDPGIGSSMQGYELRRLSSCNHSHSSSIDAVMSDDQASVHSHPSPGLSTPNEDTMLNPGSTEKVIDESRKTRSCR